MTEARVACLCPPDRDRHPSGEVVTFRPTMDFRTATAARKSVGWLTTTDPGVSEGDILAMLTEFYLEHCIESWTVHDAKGKSVPVSREAVRQYVLPHALESYELGQFADDLYSDAVLAPLVPGGRSSLQLMQNGASTSAPPTTPKTNGGGTSRKRSKPSSTTSTPTGAIATT